MRSGNFFNRSLGARIVAKYSWTRKNPSNVHSGTLETERARLLLACEATKTGTLTTVPDVSLSDMDKGQRNHKTPVGAVAGMRTSPNSRTSGGLDTPLGPQDMRKARSTRNRAFMRD